MAASYRFALNSRPGEINVVTVAWTSAADGTYSESFDIAGTITGFETDPGATAPTDNYDIVLNSAGGTDLLMGGGANRDTANTEYFVPLATGSDGGTKMPVSCAGTATLSITNAGNAKTGTVYIYFR